MNKIKPILVLGANGFVGSHLVDSLIAAGFKVRAFDRFASSTVQLFDESENIEIVAGDFLNQADIKVALSGVETVFHLVSTTNPASAENDPLIDIDTNLHGSVELFKLCAENNVKHVLFTSSGGTVYGDRFNAELIKEDDPTLPVSPYGIAKLAAENYLRYFKAKHGLDYTVFRLANPYGERQPFWRRQGVISIFLDKILSGEPITILGDGTMVRDYIYVKDATDMMVRALLVRPKHDLYNIGSGVGTSVNSLADTIEKITGLQSVRKVQEIPATFVHTSVLDTTRYINDFSFAPKIDIDLGIKMAYEYYLTQPQHHSMH